MGDYGPAKRTFRCDHCRRRAVRHRRRASSAAQLSRKVVCDPRKPGFHRRHMGSVSLSGHSLGFRHVHDGLFVSPVDGCESDCGRPFDPQLHPRYGEGGRHRPPHPVQSSGRPRILVVARRAVDRRNHVDAKRRDGRDLHLQFSVHVLGILPLCRRLLAGIRGNRQLQRPPRSSAALARRSRLCEQARRRDRQRRHGRYLDSLHGEDCSPCDDAAALADLYRFASRSCEVICRRKSPMASRAGRTLFLACISSACADASPTG